MQVSDLMTRVVEMIAPTDSIQEAARKMADEDFGVLPVAEFDRLVGVVTDRDIVTRAIAWGRMPDKTSVRDVMSTDVAYVFEDDSSDDAARKMALLQVKRLPVLNGEKRVVGILSLGDMATMRLTRAEASEALSAISRPNQNTHAHI
ncbi:MAG: CBS domain-containing protein [Rhodospirillaceae bacterium]